MIAALNAGDWARFRATVAPDLVYEETGPGRRVEGADAHVAVGQGRRDLFPDYSGTIERAVMDGPVVAQALTWEGTQQGPLPRPGGAIPLGAAVRARRDHVVTPCATAARLLSGTTSTC